MALLASFFVDQDLCTECGDCIKILPQAFRQVEDEETAEAYAELDDAQRSKLEKMMADCPGHAILWKK